MSREMTFEPAKITIKPGFWQALITPSKERFCYTIDTDSRRVTVENKHQDTSEFLAFDQFEYIKDEIHSGYRNGHSMESEERISLVTKEKRSLLVGRFKSVTNYKYGTARSAVYFFPPFRYEGIQAENAQQLIDTLSTLMSVRVGLPVSDKKLTRECPQCRHLLADEVEKCFYCGAEVEPAGEREETS